MRRVFLNNLDKNIEYYEVDYKNREFHHLRNVLRCKVNDVFEVFNGKGLTGVGIVEDIAKSKIAFKVYDFKFFPENESKINIAVGIIKPQNFNLILSAMVQIGVNKIYPFTSEYSYIKNFPENKVEKWNNILIDAAKQSGNNYLTFIDKIYTIYEVLSFDYPCRILFNSKGGDSFHSVRNSICTEEKVLVCIGPEGGFSDLELDKFRKNGFYNIKLKSNILRTETGALAIVSILKFIIGEI